MSNPALRPKPQLCASAWRMPNLTWKAGLILLAAFAISLQWATLHAQEAVPARASAFEVLWQWFPYILEGFALNLGMSFGAMAIATVFGIFLGLGQISRLRVISWPSRFVTHILRNSPWLVILFMVMYLVPFEIRLPVFGKVSLPDWIKATFAFSLPVLANISEILRGAVNSIPKGQWDSAESLAFTRRQILWEIILPQCFKRMIPAWMNWYALLALATPMASILGVRDVVGNTQAAMEAAGARPDLLAPFYIIVMGLFFLYIYPISIWTRKLERKYAVAN